MDGYLMHTVSQDSKNTVERSHVTVLCFNKSLFNQSLFNQTQRVLQRECSFSQLVSLPWQPVSSDTDNYGNH